MSATIQPRPRLYALLTGITGYRENISLGKDQVYFPRLSGCVKDVERVKEWLGSENYYQPEILVLTNEEATKKAVSEAFLAHLGKAGENDLALFYFSGHGTQEHAEKGLFGTETDNRLESIACYYDEDSKDDFLLADKELRWLIGQVAKQGAPLVTLFDCCHSGDNTRNAALLNGSYPRAVEKRVKYSFPARNWEQFIFSKAISKDQLATEGIQRVMPEGFHYSFSACDAYESAVEIDAEGVFTKTFLQILRQAGGEISYHSLYSRLKLYMQQVYEQKPRLYVSSGRDSDLHRLFLHKPFTGASQRYGEITYNEGRGRWLLNLGALHGITQKNSLLEFFDPAKPQEIKTGKITAIHLDHCELGMKEEPDRSRVYKTRVEDLKAGQLKLHIAGNHAEPADLKEITDQLLDREKPFLSLEEDEKKSDYVLRYLPDVYYLTRPGDPYRPVCKPLAGGSPDLAQELTRYLEHISRWEYTRQMVNDQEKNRIPDSAAEIEIRIGKEPYKKIQDQDKLDIRYERQGNEWKNDISVRITNRSTSNLYCGCLYLVSDFQVCSGFLNPPSYLLEPGNSVELNGGQIAVEWSDMPAFYNWETVRDTLKFYFSTEPFDTALVGMEALPPPPLPGMDTDRAAEKGLVTGQHTTKIRGWTTLQADLCFHNPEFNRISKDRLQAMLEDQATSPFALGLYFEASTDHLAPALMLRPEIQVKEEGEKGMVGDRIIDIANWWSRRKRNRHFERALAQFPHRVKMVSEGDSWFQHPLVPDIIDHLHRVYNIYCVAAAGDTLRNYFSQDKRRGEYFLDAIDQVDPAFFLVSGGGNDILGAQFRTYLVDNPAMDKPDGEDPRRFFKQEIWDELNALMEIYDTGFGHLQTHKPGIQVIVHGYDYPVKLNDANKGWLGRYMIEKGISRPGDRKAAIRYLLDQFNDRLSSVCAKYRDTVHYIDARGLTRFDEKEQVDQWYDEIHPNGDGFQQIAMRFIQTIDGILREKAPDKTMLTI